MLHQKVIDEGAAQVLKDLMKNESLREKQFFLAGGTALALLLGHRVSKDLDIFTAQPFSSLELAKDMKTEFGVRFTLDTLSEIGLRARIDDVKVDMIHYPYPPLKPPQQIEGIRLLHIDDLAAMKIHAIANRGLKRDFIDLSEIVHHRPLGDILNTYEKQFKPSVAAFKHVQKSLLFFGDAENGQQPVEVLNGRNWINTKAVIQAAVRNPNFIIQTGNKIKVIKSQSILLEKKEILKKDKSHKRKL